jgi:hypothetical protein
LTKNEIEITYEFCQFGLRRYILKDLSLKKHVPNIEDLQQLDHLVPVVRFSHIYGLLPDKLKQKCNFFFKIADEVSLNVLNYRVYNIN